MNYKLSDALNEVRDEYIEAAANLRPRTGGKWVWATAAVLALVIAAGAVAHSWQTPGASLEQPGTEPAVTAPQPTVLPTEPSVQPTQPITPPAGGAKIYWAKSSVGDYYPEVTDGEIRINLNLKNAMEESTNTADLFAVLVEETTFRDREEVYKEVIQPIGAQEEYMEKGVVYLTKAQIENLESPKGMSIQLKLCVQPDVLLIYDGKAVVSEEYFLGLEENTLNLWIVFKNDDCFCDERSSTQSCAFDTHKKEFLADYGIPEESWMYICHRYEHAALLWNVDVETVSEMLNDPRIERLWNMYGLDKFTADRF